METLDQLEAVTETIASDNRRSSTIWHRITLAIALTALLCVGYLGWAVHSLTNKVNDLGFGQTVSDYNHDNDLLTPEVGTIQFLHRGYTITFNSVRYTPSGLELTGTIGNPTQLTLSGINLKLAARPYPYQVKDKVLKNEIYLLFGEIDIGSGQTSIERLIPGGTALFSMTIPNVKQTSDSIQIAASFSNERYSY
jgi:hypothetical protein